MKTNNFTNVKTFNQKHIQVNGKCIQNLPSMKRVSMVLFLMVACSHIFGQTLSKSLIIEESKDFNFIKAKEIAFDAKGNYCFVVKKDSLHYFVTKHDTIGGFKFTNRVIGNSCKIYYTQSSTDPRKNIWYYKNDFGIKIFGPETGDLKGFGASDTKNNIAFSKILNDSVYNYVNNKLVSKINLKNSDEYYTEYTDDWCGFSENGNNIYFTKKDSLYFLYLNGNKIDSSKEIYDGLTINDNGDYLYAKGFEPEKKIDGYDYMFFIHSKDTVLDKVRTILHSDLKNNGAYYYSGDDNGSEYIAINDKLYKGIKNISNVTLIDKTHFLYTFTKNEKPQININGKIYKPTVEKLFYPILDDKGNFAFYGLKDYYLYKYINGKKEKNPITKYRVRPIPLYISPEGESVHYFKTSDSIYLYRDDKLLLKPIQKKEKLAVHYADDFIYFDTKNEKAKNGSSLFYLEYGHKGYFVYNGLFSKPFIRNKDKIIEAKLGNKGFFVILKTGPSSYSININNTVYKKISNLDSIVGDNFFFDQHKLIFYGIKGKSFYRYKIGL